MFRPKLKTPYNIFFFLIRLTKSKFSARAENIHIINLLDDLLGSKYASVQRLSIFKNRMKSVENKAMLKSDSQC